MPGPSFRTRQAIGAGATIANIVQGTAVEYFGRAAVLRVFGNADIVGMSHSLAMFRGSEFGELVIPSSALQVATTAGVVKIDEDLIAQFPIPAGTHLVHSATNPGAASNVTFLYIVE